MLQGSLISFGGLLTWKRAYEFHSLKTVAESIQLYGLGVYMQECSKDGALIHFEFRQQASKRGLFWS